MEWYRLMALPIITAGLGAAARYTAGRVAVRETARRVMQYNARRLYAKRMTVGSKSGLSGKGYRLAMEGKASYGRGPMKVGGRLAKKPFYSGKYYKVRAASKYRKGSNEARGRKYYSRKRRRSNRWI